MRVLSKKPQLLVALAACAALIAGCGGGNTSSVVPNTPKTNNPGTTPQSVGHRIPFYSLNYLKDHPELAPVGLHAAHGRHLDAVSNLVYNGGPVQHSPKVYLVFWGWSSSSDTTHDPDGMASYLVNFFNALGGSNLGNVQTQYYDNTNGNITNPHPELAGTWYDSSSLPPTTYTESNIQSEANKAVSHFGYSADADYFIVTPHNYTTSGFGSQWCAFHNSMSGGSGPIAYTDFPYVPDAGSGCGVGNVNSPGTLDGASIVGGHEAIETITDPGAGNGWLDSAGSEIGDKCAWTNDQNVSLYGGASFAVQPEWSNAASGCAFSYGSATPPPSPTPGPTATPVPTPTPSSGGCTGQLLLNPGFESGQANWSSTSGVINTDGAYSHSGVGYSWLDGYGTTHTDTLSQSVTIKSGCGATLTYYLWITTQESTTTYAYDTLKLSINGTVKQTFSNLNHTSGYVQKSLDLSAYAGQTVTIKWTGSEDASLATNFWIDDTALNLH